MKKNNKKGFTLIEIIITLGLILLITGVAIGSFVGISKQKKKEEWALVKGQIETAAEQYFSSNKYMFEGLSGSVTSTITMQNLVNNNYLNKVINPMTGNPVNECSYVEVKYENDKFVGSYKEESDDCSSNNNGLITITEPGAVDGVIEYYKADDTFTPVTKSTGNDKVEDNWWNASDLGAVNYGSEESLKVCIKVEKGKSISGVEIYGNPISKTTTKDGKDYYCVQYPDIKLDNVKFMVETNANNQNRKWVAFANIYVDTVNPINTVELYKKNSSSEISSSSGLNKYTNNTWLSGWVFTEAKVTDSLSGVNTCYYTITGKTPNVTNKNGCYKNIKDEGTSYVKYKACDKAGNCTDYTKNYTVKLDRTKPTISVSLYKKSSGTDISSSSGLNKYTNNTWLSGWVFTKADVTDSISGIASYKNTKTTKGTSSEENILYRNINEEGTHNIIYSACDKAGNCSNSNNYTINLDRTKPTLSVSLYKKSSGTDISSSSGLVGYTNNTWLSGWVYTEANATDTLSGLNTCYYTATGKTSNATDARSCQRNINAEGTSYVKYKACDKAGNCTDYTNNYTVKLDRTKPTLSVSLYKKSSGTDISSSSGLSRYTNNTWLKGWVYTEANATDTLSGVNACYYTATGKTSNATNAKSCQRNINAEGTSYVKYKACDNAGNCTDYTNNYTIKLDRTAPEITHSGTYTANCTSFKELAGNPVEYRNKIYIEDYLSGVDNTGYEYTYSSGPGTYTGWISNSHSLARSNTEILSRNSDNSWGKIRQDYNFLVNDNSTFTIQATDNAGNTSNKLTTSQSKHNSTSSSGYCRKEHGENSTVKNNYLNKCSSQEINCYVSKDD